jgi:hypothetical protein
VPAAPIAAEDRSNPVSGAVSAAAGTFERGVGDTIGTSLGAPGGPTASVGLADAAGSVDHAWRRALKSAGLADPQPTIHDLRHTHVSSLIADGWDPVEIAARIGDTLATTLAVYSHEFDTRRRGEQRRKALEARYDAGMATHRPQQSATSPNGGTVEVADLQAVRDGRR